MNFRELKKLNWSFWSNSKYVVSVFPEFYKWYQSNLLMTCGIGALHDMIQTRTSRDLRREIVTP
jgi:hypothetical protein